MRKKGPVIPEGMIVSSQIIQELWDSCQSSDIQSYSYHNELNLLTKAFLMEIFGSRSKLSASKTKEQIAGKVSTEDLKPSKVFLTGPFPGKYDPLKKDKQKKSPLNLPRNYPTDICSSTDLPILTIVFNNGDIDVLGLDDETSPCWNCIVHSDSGIVLPIIQKTESVTLGGSPGLLKGVDHHWTLKLDPINPHR